MTPVAPSSSTPTPTPTPTPSGAPKTLEAAVAAAQENVDRFASGDFAGTWLLFTKEVRKGISQKDYVTLNETCKRVGMPIKAIGVRMDGDSKAIVRLEVAGLKSSRTMVYEDNAWYMAPSPDFKKQLGKPVKDIIAAEKKAGSC